MNTEASGHGRAPGGDGAGSLSTQLRRELANTAQSIEQAVEASQKGVLDAMGRLRELLAIGRQQTADRKKLNESVDTDSGLAKAIGCQADATREFESSSAELMTEHMSLIEESMGSLDRMGEASAEIASIASMSLMVTINAKIQAAQLGEAGASFFVIAGEMQRLSERVDSLNAELSAIADRLQQSLPRAQESLQALASRQEQFRKDTEANLQAIRGAHDTATLQLSEFIENGDARNQEMIDTSNRIISALSFQDPVEKSLRTAAGRLEALARDAGEVPAGGDDAGRDAGVPGDGTVPAASREPAPGAAPAPVASGAVMML